MPAEIERKSYPFEFKVVDAALGIVEMYVAVFNNTDDGDDIIRYGFFDDSVACKLPKGVWSHDWTIPVAKTLATYPVPAGDSRLPDKIVHLGGQYVKSQFNLNTQRGKDAFSDIQFGTIDEFSIGYWPTEVNYLAGGQRELIKGDWLEWSPVLAGMNPLTQLVSVKSRAGDALPFADDLALLVDGLRAQDKEIARVLVRASARHDMREKAGRELSAQNETMLDECASCMETHVSNIRSLLSRVRGEASAPEGIVKGITASELMALRMNIARARIALVS